MHSWVKTAIRFAQDLRTYYQEKVDTDKEAYHVKVALLDDGVDPTYDHIGANLYHFGWPLADPKGPGEGPQSFYVSTSQHGSKMAAIIRKVCPFVAIYVAKLGVRSGRELARRTFSLEQVTKVEIISLLFFSPIPASLA